MPKQVYIEDTIERSIQLVKNQLTNVIYPAYDATYRMDKKKGIETTFLDSKNRI